MPTTTGPVGLRGDGTVQLYVPPGTVDVSPALPPGTFTVEYGEWQNLGTGELIAPGTWQIQGNSVETIGSPTLVRTVTLVPLSSE